MSRVPTDWLETTVGQSTSFLTGFPFSSASFSDQGVLLLRGSNVKRGLLDWSPEISRYWPLEEPRFRPFRLADGDIVIAMDGALVGRSYARVHANDLPAYLVQRVARLRGTSIEQALLYQWIGSDRFAKYADSVKTHTAIPHISPRDIRDFGITVPGDPAEQRRLSEALDDADQLVSTLERALAKKWALKQGIAQELLIGRSRLAGFAAEWRTQLVSDLLSYEQPTPYLVASTDYIGSGTPVLTAGKTFLLGYTGDRGGIYSATPVIIFDDFTTDSKFVTFPFKAKSSAMKILSAKSGGNLRYLYERMQLINFVAVDHKRRWISEYSKLEIDIPDEEEQAAIADVLADADAEIDTLKRRLDKAKAIKQGMAQQLLTGRVRVPVSGVAE